MKKYRSMAVFMRAPVTGVCAFVCGSKTLPIPRPIATSMTWPDICAKFRNRMDIKPRSIPTIISFAIFTRKASICICSKEKELVIFCVSWNIGTIKAVRTTLESDFQFCGHIFFFQKQATK